MNSGIDKRRHRERERARGDWQAYVWTNRWTDSLKRTTDRQMALLLGQVGLYEIHKQATSLADGHNVRYTDINSTGMDRKTNKLDILM